MPGDWMIVNNEDTGNYAYLDIEEPERSLREYVNWAADRLPCDVWEVNAATPDVCFCPSAAGEVLGERMMPQIVRYMEQEGGLRHRGGTGRPADGRSLAHIAYFIHRLSQTGRDVLQVQADELRRRDIRVVAEVRMSDTHHRVPDELDSMDGSALQVSEWVAEHPEYIIRRSDGIAEVALDYSHAEVREHRLAIISDLVTSRRIDGLSLNFNRWSKHFERDSGEQMAPVMTEFVGRIRAVLDDLARKRGAERLLLGARVLSSVDESLHVGVDVGAMMQRGYLDYAVVSTQNESRPDLRVEEFAELARGTDCRILGHMGDMIGGSWPGPPAAEERGLARNRDATGYLSYLNTEEEARAVALNLRAWGATGIGFWNLPCNMNPFGGQKWGADPEQVERMIRWSNAVARPERIPAGPRRYHFLPTCKRDFVGVQRNYAFCESGRNTRGGEYLGTVLHFNEGRRGLRQVFPFRMADGRDGGRLAGRLRFRIFHCDETDAVALDINGAAVPEEAVTRTIDRSDPQLNWTWFEMSLADCPPLRGDNELGLTWHGGAEHGLDVPYLEELDIRVER
ncbi:MAG: hypothetical protein U9R79_01225 [Armatimonadota bacterium]|nr:hypothetical protein [Armatimonadota bacterium]